MLLLIKIITFIIKLKLSKGYKTTIVMGKTGAGKNIFVAKLTKKLAKKRLVYCNFDMKNTYKINVEYLGRYKLKANSTVIMISFLYNLLNLLSF